MTRDPYAPSRVAQRRMDIIEASCVPSLPFEIPAEADQLALEFVPG